MKMLDNKVAIEVLKESAKKGGLLHIPEDNFNAGKVAFMGPECKDIEVGQLVCFGPERETIKSNGFYTYPV